MPACALCKEVKTKLDAKNLCSVCRPKCSQSSSDQSVSLLEDVVGESFDLESQCNITIRDLLDIVRKAISVELLPIGEKIDLINTQLTQLKADVADHGTKITQINTACSNNQTNIEKVESEVETLKNVILRQQEFMEAGKRKELEGNIILKGVPKGNLILNDTTILGPDNSLEKTLAVLDYLDCTTDEDEFELIDIPSSPNHDTMLIKLKFSDKNKVKSIMTNAKKLKDIQNVKIFVKRDEPYYSRKENDRLRKKRYDLSLANRDDELKIEKGKLYHNGIVIDKFDLNNQIF